MKREIKFKAKDIDTGEWVFGGISFAADGKAFIVSTGKDHLGYITMMREIDINTLEQFTCLRDTNGKEIYEGDIVRCRSRESINRQYTSDYLFIVVFNEDNCKFELVNVKDNKLIYELDKRCEDDYRVEGNIYDIPELGGMMNERH